MTDLNLEKAFSYYQDWILNPVKLEILREHGFSTTGSVNSVDWEVFAAILFNEKKNICSHTDLENFEVKSASLNNNGFEYQYQKLSGLEKLESEKSVGHIYISYSPDYRDIEVNLVYPENIKGEIESWKQEYCQRQFCSNAKFRKKIKRGFLKENSELILKISNCQIEYFSPPSETFEFDSGEGNMSETETDCLWH